MKIATLLILVLSLVFTTAHATLSVDTMKKVMEHFENADEETLAVFDIDMVLMQPENPSFQMPNIKKHSLISKKFMRELSLTKRDLFLTLLGTNSEPLLIEKEMPSYIKDLQNRKIPFIALTAILTGKVGDVNSVEDNRISHLHKCGMDFSQTSFPFKNYMFKNFPPYRGNYPLFKEGIAFTNGSNCDKGELLLSLMEKASFYPKKVIFIDDRIENLEAVENALKKLDIKVEYTGIHYLGSFHYPSLSVSEEEFIHTWEKFIQLAKDIE